MRTLFPDRDPRNANWIRILSAKDPGAVREFLKSLGLTDKEVDRFLAARAAQERGKGDAV